MSSGGFRFTMLPVMSESKVDVAQLQKRTPTAWSALLQNEPGLDNVMVTAVSAKPIRTRDHQQSIGHVSRYLVSLANQSDPINLLAKYTNRQEVAFYRLLADLLPHLAPKCWYAHVFADEGWLVLDDVPDHIPPEKWSPYDVEDVIFDLSTLHETFWRQGDLLQDGEIPHFLDGKEYTIEMLRREEAFYFEEGPGTTLSEHSIHHAGRLAPQFLQAANGLTVIRDLGGWPGVMGETHLTAVSDLLDDPVPMLEPLRNLPVTLLHGNPNTAHWRLTLFEQRRLIDWTKTAVGPSILDLVSFLEQFDLIYYGKHPWQVDIRETRPMTEETMIDSYLLHMSRLVPNFDARAFRLAIPAARCLHVLINWFPYFATWAADMPNKFTWQKVNRLSDEQLTDSMFQPMVQFRPYLTAVFQRFLRAYRSL